MGKIIYKGASSEVRENDNGTYTVILLRTHSFDGIIDQSWDEEIFEEDGIHSGGGVCTHNFPIKYYGEDKPLKERALEYAFAHENRGRR